MKKFIYLDHLNGTLLETGESVKILCNLHVKIPLFPFYYNFRINKFFLGKSNLRNFLTRKPPSMYKRYMKGEFPDCFRPAPPFYDVCNNVKHTIPANYKACGECMNKYGLTDCIE